MPNRPARAAAGPVVLPWLSTRRLHFIKEGGKSPHCNASVTFLRGAPRRERSRTGCLQAASNHQHPKCIPSRLETRQDPSPPEGCQAVKLHVLRCLQPYLGRSRARHNDMSYPTANQAVTAANDEPTPADRVPETRKPARLRQCLLPYASSTCTEAARYAIDTVCSLPWNWSDVEDIRAAPHHIPIVSSCSDATAVLPTASNKHAGPVCYQNPFRPAANVALRGSDVRPPLPPPVQVQPPHP